VDNIVGTGLRLAAKPDYRAVGRSKEWADAWAREVEARWRVHAESVYCDAGMELTFHGQTQLIEAERLSNPQMARDTERLRGGIERDRYGAPVAYWIRRTHPGDFLAGWLASGAGEWERIPARTDWRRPRVLHVHTKERTGQSRGWSAKNRPEAGLLPGKRRLTRGSRALSAILRPRPAARRQAGLPRARPLRRRI